ncbi:MAG: carbamate kinase, partial [Eubacteriales bacterium]
VGFDLQNALRSELLTRSISTPVSTILTQVTVDPYDESFYEPHKLIGRSMSKDDADIEIKKGNYVQEDNAHTYRRVVAAPQPIDIVEIEAITTLVNAEQIVIACGGGGIPVIEQNNNLKGASAVIEKDSIAAKLASDLKSDQLIIFTTVDAVYENYGTPNQTPIATMTIAHANTMIANQQFEEGTMLPKIEAAITYLQAVPTGSVLITNLKNGMNGIHGKAGTIITA